MVDQYLKRCLENLSFDNKIRIFLCTNPLRLEENVWEQITPWEKMTKLELRMNKWTNGEYKYYFNFGYKKDNNINKSEAVGQTNKCIESQK